MAAKIPQVAVLGHHPDQFRNWPEIPYFRQVITSGLKSGAQALGVGLHFIHPKDMQPRNLAELRQHAGYILVEGSMTEAAYIRDFLRQNSGVLLVPSREPGTLPSVFTDDEGGMRLIMDHLVQSGKKNIGYFGPGRHLSARRRFTAWKKIMEEVGRPRKPSLIWAPEFEPAALHESSRSYQEILRNSCQSYFSRDPAVDAIVCSTDEAAKVVLAELQKRDCPVPERCAVTGFDDLPIDVPPYGYNPFTTIRQDFRSLTALALKLALENQRGQAVQGEVRLPGTLIIRGSSDPAWSQKKPDWTRKKWQTSLDDLVPKLREVAFSPDPAAVLAAGVGLPKAEFLRKARILLGETFTKRVQTMRVDRAILLMSHTDLSLMQILTECGFQSQQDFSRVFRKIKGVSAREYRKQVLGHETPS